MACIAPLGRQGNPRSMPRGDQLRREREPGLPGRKLLAPTISRMAIEEQHATCRSNRSSAHRAQMGHLEGAADEEDQPEFSVGGRYQRAFSEGEPPTQRQ